ncbi:MAG: hypothetical protein K2X53_05590 [Alphaproteobacteria bacterium]|nr:hypothetical protein [Alphaproteobacteria bacterium]
MILITLNKIIKTVTLAGLVFVSAQEILFASCSPKNGLSESAIEESVHKNHSAFHTLESFISTANMCLAPEEQWNLNAEKRVKIVDNLRKTPESQIRCLNISYLIDDEPLRVVLAATVRPYVRAILSIDRDAFTNSVVQLQKRNEAEDMDSFSDEKLNPFVLLNVKAGGKDYAFLPHAFPRNLGLTSSYDQAYHGFWIWGLSRKLAGFTLDIVNEEIAKN